MSTISALNNSNITSTNNNVSTYSAPAVAAPSVPKMLEAVAYIDRKHPDLVGEIAEAKATYEDIKDSDTWGGLKWYEYPVAAFAIKSNKMMIRNQLNEIDKLENLLDTRNFLIQEINASRADRFERA